MTYWVSRIFCAACALAVLTGMASAQDNAASLRQASVWVEAGRYKDAVAVLKTLEAQNPEEEARINILTGAIYAGIERPAKAVEYFEEALLQAPDNMDAVLGAAQAHLQLGQFKQARHFVHSAQTHKPDSSEPDFILAAIAFRTGNPGPATARTQELLKQGTDSEGVQIAYAKYLTLTGDGAGAQHTLERFVERNPNAAAAREQLGDLEFTSGRPALGLQHKKAAAALYEKQGNIFRRDVVNAWLEVHDSPAPPAPAPSPGPEAQTAAQQSRQARGPVPVAADKEFAPPVKRFPFPAGVMITGGSGFIVDSGRKIVTNRHVVEGGKEFAVRTGLGEIIKARLLFVSSTDDIAVLELEQALPGDRAIPANAYAKPGVGRNVVVMGYPLWSVLGEGSPSLTNGMVSKRTGLLDDKGTFQITARVHKGNSGGPVFDLSGQVVGITVGKLDTRRLQDDDGKMPEDVNFAIHVDRLPPVANIQLGNNPPPGRELGTEELYQAMLGKVVMVATYK